MKEMLDLCNGAVSEKTPQILTFVAHGVRDIDFRTNSTPEVRCGYWTSLCTYVTLQTDTQTDTQTNPTTVTLAAHACRGLITSLTQVVSLHELSDYINSHVISSHSKVSSGQCRVACA